MPYELVPQLKTWDKSGSRKAGENSIAPLKVQFVTHLVSLMSAKQFPFPRFKSNFITTLTITALTKNSLRTHASLSPAPVDSHPRLPNSALIQSVQALYMNFIRYFGTSILLELLSLIRLWKYPD